MQKFNVNVSEDELSVKEQMKFYIENRKTFMLHGASGLGKSRRVQEIDPSLVTIVLRDGMLPEEITGKTAYENGVSSWIEPTWYTALKKVCNAEPDRNHVLFIDELTNVDENVQSLVFHIVLDRSIDGTLGKLPENCTVVAAGNNPKESISAKPMTEPLFRRFDAHIYLTPDIQSWLRWGSEIGKNGNPKIHPVIASFVAANSDRIFYRPYNPENPPRYTVDPRGWEQVSNIIYANNNTISKNLIMNKIGDTHTVSLMSFAQSKFISIEDIINNKYQKEDIPTNENGRFALTCSLRSVDESNVKKIREFIKQEMGGEKCAIFDELWIEDNDERVLIIKDLEDEEAKKQGKSLSDIFNRNTKREERRKINQNVQPGQIETWMNDFKEMN